MVYYRTFNSFWWNFCIFAKILDTIMLLGICLLTVFAQFFSLFYKVGKIANIVLAVLDLFFCSIFYKNIRNILNVEYKKYRFVVAIFFMFLCLYYVSEPIKNYDTALYHAQSIRWIEEYGVVPGLGNLHHRFAYNNSIFSLQALFSLKFLTGGVSLHNINGFLALIFIGYAVGSLKVFTTHKFYMSDFLRTVLISYIISQMKYISSPGSDFFCNMYDFLCFY